MTPTVNFASRSRGSAGLDFGVRLIPDYQLFLVVSGKAHLRIGTDVFTIRGGDAVFYGSEMPHRLAIVEDTEYYSMHFDWHRPSPAPEHPALRIRNIPGHAFDAPAVPYVIDVPEQAGLTIPTLFNAAYLAPVLERIVNEYKQEKTGYAFMLRALLMELIALWMRQLRQADRERAGSRKVEPAVQAISDHPEQNWTIAELAALCGYHPIYFSKLFREEVGVAPKAYLIKEKLRKAKLLLLENMKIEEIADRLQYGSVHYFSHHFKKTTGLTPTDFRQQGGRSDD